MASRLTVIFYIILCLEAGVVLTLLPWVQPFGMGDWGENFFLLYASQKIGFVGLQDVVSSGWVRGAVTGLGLLNVAMALWEMAHFRQTVRTLQAQVDAPPRTPAAVTPAADAAAPAAPAREALAAPVASSSAASADAPNTPTADHLSHHERRDDARDHSVR